MAKIKVSFVPSTSPAAVGYKLYYGKYSYALSNSFDLACTAADGRLEAVVDDVVLDNQYYAVRAFNAAGEESDDSMVVQYDPRIEPPTEVVIVPA